MRTLYHLWLCPFARKVRVVLAEKKLPFDLEIEKVWERRDGFLALNPAGEVPAWLHRYNWYRPHGGIYYSTPVSGLRMTRNILLRLHR